ncbi:MAG: hypothetical protein K8R21_01400 [Leptospira sp.]|nr:hypothetical protein [Leptospira sp.]
MPDFANDPLSFPDIVLDPGTNDIQVETDDAQVILSQIVESFEMRNADDIDYPEIYSRQRLSMNSDKLGDRFRVNDAERIIALNPLINPDSIEVEMTEQKRLRLNFKLKSGQAVRDFVMR